jgi:hypothetical protein
VDFLDASQHCQGRRVGQVPLHGAPDALDRVVMGRVAGAVQQADAGVSGQPALDARLECVPTLSRMIAMTGAVG